MPRYAKEITALLRSMLWGEPLACDGSVLLEPGLWYMARRQQLDHMLAVWAMNQNLPILNPQERKLRVFQNLQRAERQRTILVDVVGVLRAQGVEPVLIKGQSMSALYENPDMRVSSDVDLYIGERDYDKMIRVMKEAYRDAHWFSEEHAGLHFAVVMDEQQDLAVELHRVAMELHNMPRADKAFQTFTHEEMEHTRRMRVGETEVRIPSLSFDALYIFMHAWHHFESSGVGLRQLADWTLALHAASAEQGLAERLEPLLRDMHMLEIWQTFGWVLVNRLGLPREEMPLYIETPACARKGEQLYAQLIKDGHCGREPRLKIYGKTLYYFPYQRPERGRMRQKVYTLCRMTFQLTQMRKLFPSYAYRNYIGALLKKKR